MRIAFIHLSDIHCTESNNVNDKKIEAAVSAVELLEPFDKIAVIVSGDITSKGQKKEYIIAKRIILKFISKLKDSMKCGYIPLILVPGNHDICINENDRTFEDILKCNKSECIRNELDKMENFFEYSKSQNAFTSNKLYYSYIWKLQDGKIKIKFNMINSAPFSTLKPNDKELHYIPQKEIELISGDDVDLSFLVSHHSFEWFEKESSYLLRNACQNVDFALFGHDHLAETIDISVNSREPFHIIKGGIISDDESINTAFGAIIYDTDSRDANVYSITWKKNEKVFANRMINCFEGLKHNGDLALSREYKKRLFDSHESPLGNLEKYFVMPKLTKKENDFLKTSREISSIREVFETLRKEEIICICGEKGCGKTSLIKHIYVESRNNDFLPLLFEKKSSSGNFDKLFKHLFEEQYEEHLDYDVFLQSKSQILILIDDIDLIDNDKSKEKLIDYIMEKGWKLIFTTSERINDDLIEIVKDKLSGRKIQSMEIKPFFKEKRDLLIRNICSIMSNEETETNETRVIANLDYVAQSQAEMFPLTPDNIIQYVKYFIKENSNASRNQTLAIVFETNIRNELIRVDENDITVFMSLLETIAFKMYFDEKSEFISLEKITSLIGDFNKQHMSDAKVVDFLTKVGKAGIFINILGSDDYKFSDNNTFAYFIAKYIDLELEKNPTDLRYVNYVMEHICFGINDSIIIFLSYIRRNSRIILNIAFQSKKLLENIQELNFDSNNLPFIKTTYRSSNSHLSVKEKKEKIVKKLESEEEKRYEKIKFKGIFDFKEDDVKKTNYVILRALKYTRIVARTLVEQFGSLDANEIKSMVESVYINPEKVLYAVLEPYQNHHKEIISNLHSYFIQYFPEKDVTEEKISKSLGQAAAIFCLNIMNDISFNCASTNTVGLLTNYETKSLNQELHKLMMYDNAGDSDVFVEHAIELFEQREKDSFAKNLISQIAVKHVIYSENANNRQVDRMISKGILAPNDKKRILIDSKRETENKRK